MPWYAIVKSGSHPAPARGPFKTLDSADLAADSFRFKHGAQAGTYLAAGSVRIVGPFTSRAEARSADISNAPVVKEVR